MTNNRMPNSCHVMMMQNMAASLNAHRFRSAQCIAHRISNLAQYQITQALCASDFIANYMAARDYAGVSAFNMDSDFHKQFPFSFL